MIPQKNKKGANTVSRAKPTAILRGETAEAAANFTIRWTSIIVLAASFIGTIMAINGRWPTSLQFWREVSIVAIVAGLVFQGIFTLFQWGFRKRRTDPRYFVPFLLDVAATYIGYSILLIPPFTAAFERTGLPAPAPAILAHGGVILLSIFAAYYPEQNLVDD